MKTATRSVYKEIYASQLGDFVLEINSTNELFAVEEDAAGLHTVGHDIRIQQLYPPLDWMPEHLPVETATAWLFYITKRNTSQEQLTLSMLLASQTVRGEADTGENLVAVEFEDGIRQVHLGTEDEDAMAQRADVGDWMPARLRQLFLAHPSLEVTTITPTGLRTRIPLLEPGEQFYLHYIIVENPCRKSVDDPDEMDISTWYAVEQTKLQLEQAWQ